PGPPACERRAAGRGRRRGARRRRRARHGAPAGGAGTARATRRAGPHGRGGPWSGTPRRGRRRRRPPRGAPRWARGRQVTRGAAGGVRLDLSERRRVHVVAAGGAGMSGIATILAQQGHEVTGSDLAEGPALAALRRLGVSVTVGHAPEAVQGADAVVVSTA